MGPVILVGPSGVGKTTLLGRLLKEFSWLEHLKSLTTRAPRSTNDNEYHFVTPEVFKTSLAQGDFIEYAKVYGQLYGVRRSDIEAIFANGKVPIAIIDVQGAVQFRELYPPPQLIDIFIHYESFDQMEARLRQTRPGISDDDLHRRLAAAQEEISQADQCRFQVTNHEGDFEGTFLKVRAILLGEALYRGCRTP